MGQPPQDLFLLGSLSPLNHDYGSKVFHFKQLEHAPDLQLQNTTNESSCIKSQYHGQVFRI